MKRALFFVLLLLQGHILMSQNLALNPGFEAWSKLNKPFGWTHVENCLKDSLNVNSGSYSCKHTGGTTSTSDLGQTISVSPGKDYTLSLFFRTVIISTGNGARIWCYWKDASGNSISDPASDEILRPSKYLKNSSWELFAITAKAPENAASFYLEVRTYPNSITFWDDIVFEETVATMIDEKRLPEVRIFPNPATNQLTIRDPLNLQHIDIICLAGIIVWSEEFNGETEVTISVADLPDGIYHVRIRTSAGFYTRKIIKKAC